ncbi:HAMP domain-containing histidine kinase [Thalassotalea sp. HSM 43]|uniref:sensor histidine kinase n=1 Tax=Thalassotalea sp. HSM 43 TaxID=2552945 RepID=UPI001080FB91|nr:HAMP domain-containing sensor histidine kinase [Thalassotalea sp. HSM 43]QBY05440.1 HAMP domain-containing histidine kinase [Thalassotalea sp. HSM 43]
MIFSQIRTRIVAYFIAMALFISVLFAALGLLFSYYIEDAMFSQLLNDEMAQVQTQIEQGQQPDTNLSFVRFYQHAEQLPKSVKDTLAEEPNRHEFYAEDGKHYHLKRSEQGYLLAEVSEYLIVRKIKGNMAKTTLIFMFIISLFVAFLSWSLAKRLIKPIDNLMQVISSVKGQELPENFSKPFAKDEIGVFARELERAMQRVRQFIEREQHFTRDVSHELRTPIAISQGALTLLNDTPLSAEQQQLSGRIGDAQLQMQQCIEGLLALARETEFSEEPVTLMPLIESCVVEHHQLLEQKDIELSLQVNDTAQVKSNKQALKIIISNLIGNAFNHCQQGGINIDFTNNCLTIADSGPGIDRELLPKIFQSGVKGRGSEGFGIGLSLVKRLCEKLDIDLGIDSDQNGTKIRLQW